jgi:hypothetical protein
MGICIAITDNVGMGVAVNKTVGVRVRVLDSVTVSNGEYVGSDISVITGKKEVDETGLFRAGVVVCITTAVWVSVLDKDGVYSSGFVGMGDCPLSGRREVVKTDVPLIGVGVESGVFRGGGGRFIQAVRHRHIKINNPFLKISMVLC